MPWWWPPKEVRRPWGDIFDIIVEEYPDSEGEEPRIITMPDGEFRQLTDITYVARWATPPLSWSVNLTVKRGGIAMHQWQVNPVSQAVQVYIFGINLFHNGLSLTNPISLSAIWDGCYLYPRDEIHILPQTSGTTFKITSFTATYKVWPYNRGR